MNWQLRRPHRWFNQLLFYVGWLALLLHIGIAIWCWWHAIYNPLSWWYTALAPALCVLWGGVPALQLQPEARQKQTGMFDS